jgi:drug/metabolite transporter (DMT)-like permease
VTATFFRAAYAVPVLALVWRLTRARDHRSRRERRLAFTAGLFLAVDLDLWHKSIAFLGAGLATVLPNMQIVFVALAAWVLWGERPTVRTLVTIAVMLGGVVLISGLARQDAYGARPIAGVLLGVGAGACYSIFLLVFRTANRSLAPTSGPLLDATLGVLLGALVSAWFDPAFTFRPGLEPTMWLVLLALVSQVLGWLLIAVALPRLPAVETSVLLLVQPVFAILWGILIFSERLSTLQWTGSAIVLLGVASLSRAPAVVETR